MSESSSAACLAKTADERVSSQLACAGVPAGARRRGFTLIEFLLVAAIMSMLAAVVVGAGRRVNEIGRTARARAELAAIAAALESCKRHYGDYPATADPAELLQVLSGQRGLAGASARGRAMLDQARFRTATTDQNYGRRVVLLDPWQQPYVYVYREPAAGWTNSSHVLYSMGPDGAHQPGLGPGGFPDRAAGANLDNVYTGQ